MSLVELQFEAGFIPEPEPFRWMNQSWHVPIACIVAYVVMVFGFPVYMKNREPLNVGSAFAYWNLFLSIFSFIGVSRVLPKLIHNIADFGFRYAVCSEALTSYGSGSAGLWVWLFIVSKLFELGDTFFLIAKKSRVPFLHWYHHITVLLYCWHSYVTKSSNGVWFSAMNLLVHTLMYYYFYRAEVGHKPVWGKPLTALQISQMAVGIFITVASMYYVYDSKNGGPMCNVDPENITASLVMYFSYFLLFVKFYLDTYIFKSRRKRD